MSILQYLSHFQKHSENSYEVAFDATWTQGRTLFGGVLGALAHHFMLQQLSVDWSLQSLMFDFLAPVTPEPFRVRVEVIRKGRTLARLQAHFEQNNRTCCIALAAFGVKRQGALTITPTPPPNVRSPEDCPSMPTGMPMIPEFTRHFSYRWANQNVPYSQAKEAIIQGWIRPKHDRVDMDYLIAMIDAWPPPILSIGDRPFPVSSVNWLLNVARPIPTAGLPADEWYLFESKSEFANAGCTDLAARLWDSQGRLVAISRQLLVEFSDKVYQ